MLGKKLLASIMQANFSTNGHLIVQLSLSKITMKTEKVGWQMTLDVWLWSAGKPAPANAEGKLDTRPKNSFEDLDDTISCIELEMKRDKRGYIINWMKDEHQGDNWDGSIDNQEKSLENHVGKYGWYF